jgi:hypothetical protein
VGQETRKVWTFSRLKDFVQENRVETSDTGTDQCIKDHSVNVQARFCIFQKQ